MMKVMARKIAVKRPRKERGRGFRVTTGVRAGNVLRNTLSAIPPTLLSYG